MPYKDKDRQRKYQRDHAREIYKTVWEYKNDIGCQLCGESDPACLDLHHREVDEKYKRGTRAYDGQWSLDRLISELDKCIVLCANCHRKIHYYFGKSFNGRTVL